MVDTNTQASPTPPTEIAVNVGTHRFPVVRKDATKQDGAITFPVTACERMNVHVGGLIPFAWERPDAQGSFINLCDIFWGFLPRFCQGLCEYFMISAIFLRNICGVHF